MENTKTTPRFNYTGNAWEGENYKGEYKSATDLAKIFRYKAKELFPDCKFSITKQDYSGGRSFSISLMAAPFKIFNEVDKIMCEQKSHRYCGDTPEKFAADWQFIIDKGHHQINQYYIKDDYILTEKAKEIMTKILGFIQSYNYDDSDAMIDYFNTNFYIHSSIGKWDKPFIQLT